MGSLHRSVALLGFHGDDLDPGEITTRLGAEPTVAMSKGGRWLTSSAIGKIAATGAWRLEADDGAPADLDGQITQLLAPLSADVAAWRALASRYHGRLFCGLFLASGNAGVTLKPATLVMIGQRGLVLDLDIYGAGF
ncbi:hypothetical protein BH10PSE14_BH10PSE14_43780 [soil metagenome]